MVASVDVVVALALPPLLAYCSGTGGVAGSFPVGTGGSCFFWAPNDHDRPPGPFINPDGLDFGTGTSVKVLLFANFHSSCAFRSAEDGVVDALLWRDELSVEFVLVVLDDPLPLLIFVRSKFHSGWWFDLRHGT